MESDKKPSGFAGRGCNERSCPIFFSGRLSVNPSNGLDSRGIVERPCLGTPGFWHFEEHGIRTLLEVRVVPQGQGGVVAYNFK